MNKEKQCDHVVAFRFGHEESSFTGDLIHSSNLAAPKSSYYFEKINESEDYVCKYCPRCGVKIKKEKAGGE